MAPCPPRTKIPARLPRRATLGGRGPTMISGTGSAVVATPWQHAWLDAYPCDVPSSVPYPRAPLTVLLESAARRFPDRSACTLYGEALSYADLEQQTRRMAQSLHHLGAANGR